VQKLLDWHARWAELEASPNPFALVVMTHLKAQECQDGPTRKGWKLRLVRLLYQRGYTREQVPARIRRQGSCSRRVRSRARAGLREIRS